MFTGLIETTGTVLSLTPTPGGATRLLLSAPTLAGRWRQGDSIAVNGVCLTAIPASHPNDFAADLAAETIARTTLAHLAPGSIVNLELPTPAGAPLGGHVVQGHVDGTGTLISLQPLGTDLATADWRLTLELPAALAAHVVQQGSITVNGISLTVAKLHAPAPDSRALAGQAPDGPTRLEIAIIPHTYRATNLHTLAPGSPVNIETDILARYAQKQPPQPEAEWLTPAYLLANGY
jgi:riboflavin synthase